jgi:hypothetical protein
MSFIQTIRPRPRLMFMFRKRLIVYAELLSHAQPCSWRTALYRLSSAAFSMYSQLLSTPAGRPSIRNLRTRHAVVSVTRLTWGTREDLKIIFVYKVTTPCNLECIRQSFGNPGSSVHPEYQPNLRRDCPTGHTAEPLEQRCWLHTFSSVTV